MTALPRGRCSVCCTSVPKRANGDAREHQAPKNLDRSFVGKYGKCNGSGRPVTS